MKLSIAMMVKNESKHLDKCLNSLSPILKKIDSELIIVDTGSKDDTVDIAKRYTDKVYFHEWNNHFAQMRNITLSYASGEWFFYVDGDEILQNPQGIIQFFSSKQCEEFNTGLVSIKNISNEADEGIGSIFLAPRLFKKDKDFHFRGAIHNQPSHKGPYIELNALFFHYGYVSSDKQLMETKFQRTGTILKAELEKDPNNIYYWYQLSVTYGMHGDDKEAVDAALKAYELAKEEDSDVKKYMYVYLQLIKVYINKKQFKEAETVCDEILGFGEEGYVDLHFYSAKSKGAVGKYEEAIYQYNKYLDCVNEYNSNGIRKDATLIHYTLDMTETVYYDLCVLHIKKKNYSEASKYIKMVKSKKMKFKKLRDLIKIYFTLGEFDELYKFYVYDVLEKNADFVQGVEDFIEKTKEGLAKRKREEMENVFSKGVSPYCALNRIRIENREGGTEDIVKFAVEIEKMNFEELPCYYGDTLQYLLRTSQSPHRIFDIIPKSKLRDHIEYISKKNEDFSEIVKAYVKENADENLQTSRIKKELLKYMMIVHELSDADFKVAWERYIDSGTYYVTHLYHPQVIEEQMHTEMKEDEEVFLMYVYHALKFKHKDLPAYVNYVRKAFRAYPFKKAAELVRNELEELGQPENSEMEELKIKFKENINAMIEQGKISQAQSLIRQYEQMIPDDLEVVFLKSQIALLGIRVNDGGKAEH